MLAIALYGLVLLASTSLASSSDSPASVAAQYSLTTSTSFPFPAATQTSSDTQSFIISRWSLSKGRIQDGGEDLAFVDDPFPNIPVPGSSATSGPVLQVTYPAGSYSKDTGGAQFINLWNTSTPLQSALVSYEIAFDSGFNWVQGGKLPGLRGGPDAVGCSGGKVPNGTDCFSVRMMWRRNGAGEAYAYLPFANQLCDKSGITCNSDFGTSVERGSFAFASGQWNRVSLLVQLNNPANSANGVIRIYYNDQLVATQQGLRFRSGLGVNVGGLYFSTFFGGNDTSWSTPQTTHTYFRNIGLWGSTAPSTARSAAGPTMLVERRTLELCVALFSIIIPQLL